MSGVALVFGWCALSFAAGCVLTAVMLRRDPPPEPASEPAPAPPMPVFEPHFPPEDYATKPIHRNPVMGIPTSLPAPRPAPRPTLVVVPDPAPGTEEPVRQDEVRRMRVVRTEPQPESESRSEPEPQARPSAATESESQPESQREAGPRPESGREIESRFEAARPESHR